MSFSTRLLAALVAVSMYGSAFAQDAATAEKPKAEASGDKAASTNGAATSFNVKDADGKTHALADYKGKIVVLEWTNPGCPYVKRHTAAGTTKKLNDKWKGKDVVFLQVNSASPSAEDAKKASEAGAGVPVLIDDGTMGKAFGAKTTPHVFVLDKEGNVAYQGAYDDDPDGEKGASAVNYVDNAIAKLSEGGKPEVAQTKPYGCGVKFKN
jgi:peroxiredoxin